MPHEIYIGCFALRLCSTSSSMIHMCSVCICTLEVEALVDATAKVNQM